MELYEQGLEYWQIAKRFHAHRNAPMMKPTALRDMTRLLQRSRSSSVNKRIISFIGRYSPKPEAPGPRFA